MSQAIEGNVKPCADGDHYAPVGHLSEMADGRLVCNDCLNEQRHRALVRSQQELFVNQESLFDFA